MKKMVAVFLMMCAMVPAFAQHHGYRHKQPNYHNHNVHRHHGHHYNWVAPLVLGGVVTYALTRPPVVIEQPPVIVHNPQPYIVDPDAVPVPVPGSTACTEWREVQYPDGKIYRERSCYQR